MCTQDNTNVRAYLPEVEAFLAEARRRGWALRTFSERDCALADMIAILCYVERAGIQRARNLFAGFVHVYPEHGGHLPEADRALKSWERLDTGGEGGPICEEAWGAVIVAFVRGGDAEGGLVRGLSFDCLLRGKDWSKLRLEDVTSSTRGDGSLEVSLMLGVRKRGETTKTGSRQGVVVGRQWVAVWLGKSNQFKLPSFMNGNCRKSAAECSFSHDRSICFPVSRDREKLRSRSRDRRATTRTRFSSRTGN